MHGITTYSFIWQRVIPKLAEKYDVIAIDLLGCGESDKPLDVSYAIHDHAERIYEFAQKLGIKKFHFIGHDLGGGMGQIFAIHHPEMLYDLTIINGVAKDFWPVQPIIAIRTPIIRQFLMGALDLGALRVLVKVGMFHKEKVTDELLAQFRKGFNGKDARKAFMHFARCLDKHNLTDIDDELRKIDLPVLILRGDADPYLTAEIAKYLHDTIPRSRLSRISTGSHYLMEDEPEWTANQILEFIG